MNHQELLPPITKNIVLNAPIEKVWKAVATSEGLESWWMPNTFEPVLGYEFVLHAGEYGDSPCKVTEIDPPYRLSFTWGNDWELTFELKKLAPEKTEFTLIHSGWDSEKVTEFDQPHSAIRNHMSTGWDRLVQDKLSKIIGA
ncbi:SRPBCC domain-containing protein [Pullulanibacillus sp. KACC 23026]|uniref:SRPBCC family protein n=1 Tax=Pullulanibacillus sp. KACC 23026 TaxID=3028315 RepID=UPI0023B0806C|nr:SRPBCC domain-containing protein [Pullulanibacillus sp. KACC 23026]WEG12175.1 SRPBCC domain-containing protein [Pullulanibacillus sp. KACC 23026]